jgi:Peptidase family M20/M25/M40
MSPLPAWYPIGGKATLARPAPHVEGRDRADAADIEATPDEAGRRASRRERAMTTPAERQAVYDRLTQRFPEFVEALSEYGRVATISARREAAEAGAEATRRVLERYGVPARLMPVPDGPPLVVGEIVVDPELPTLILYNHYDVQPVDPRGEWTHDPFTPVVEDGKLFGRGVADTKGNVVAQALAQAVIREVRGTLPLNLRFMVEGEEEIGSPHLGAFARTSSVGARPAWRREATASTGAPRSSWATRASSTWSSAPARPTSTSTARWPR